MSEENVALVRAVWDAINRGDLDEAFKYAPEDFVADWSASEAPESGVYRGRERVRALFKKTREAWSQIEYFEDEIIDAGDHVVRVGGVLGRGKGSGAEVSAHGGKVWTFRVGIYVSLLLHTPKSEAVAVCCVDNN